MKPLGLDGEDDYHSFLLRMWRVKAEDQDIWRASLEDVQRGEMHGFTCVEELIDFLKGIAFPPDYQEDREEV